MVISLLRIVSQPLILFLLYSGGLTFTSMTFAQNAPPRIDPVQQALDDQERRRRAQEAVRLAQEAYQRALEAARQQQEQSQVQGPQTPTYTAEGEPYYPWMSERIVYSGPRPYSEKKCKQALTKAEQECEKGPGKLGRLSAQFNRALAENNMDVACQRAAEIKQAVSSYNAAYEKKCGKVAKSAERVCWIKKSVKRARAKELQKLAKMARSQAAAIASQDLGSACKDAMETANNCKTIEDLRSKPECRFVLCEGRFKDQPECRRDESSDFGYATLEQSPQQMEQMPSFNGGNGGGGMSSDPAISRFEGAGLGPNDIVNPQEGRELVRGFSKQYGNDLIGVGAGNAFQTLSDKFLRMQSEGAFIQGP